MLGFRRKPCLACPRSRSQPGRSPTHLLELQVDELQPVGVNLVQVIAAAAWPIRLGALAKFGAARGHLGRGAFQRRENPRKSRGGVMRGRTLSLPPLLGLEASSSWPAWPRTKWAGECGTDASRAHLLSFPSHASLSHRPTLPSQRTVSKAQGRGTEWRPGGGADPPQSLHIHLHTSVLLRAHPCRPSHQDTRPQLRPQDMELPCPSP